HVFDYPLFSDFTDRLGNHPHLFTASAVKRFPLKILPDPPRAIFRWLEKEGHCACGAIHPAPHCATRLAPLNI
ncbi:MAG TPA: hypothetical protein PK090_02460, partial [Smithellaceae bacterium]|nr:hypothetical protein [Smithellaceae bacterium]